MYILYYAREMSISHLEAFHEQWSTFLIAWLNKEAQQNAAGQGIDT
jgi:hypothetical protein